MPYSSLLIPIMKSMSSQVVVAQAFSPSTWRVEAGALSSQLWSTAIAAKLGLHRDCFEKETKREKYVILIGIIS